MLGTGKTHTGVIIAKILLGNQHLRAKKPILFICQTNHALDQMLEHIYKFEEVNADFFSGKIFVKIFTSKQYYVTTLNMPFYCSNYLY